MDNLPDFEQPASTEPPAPKKPRKKPTKVLGKLYTSRPGRTYKPRPRKRRKPAGIPPRKHQPETVRLMMLLNLFLKIKLILEPLDKAERQSLLKMMLSET